MVHVRGERYGSPANSNFYIVATGVSDDSDRTLSELRTVFRQFFETELKSAGGDLRADRDSNLQSSLGTKSAFMGRVVVIEVEGLWSSSSRGLAELLYRWVSQYRIPGVARIGVIDSFDPYGGKLVYVLETADRRPGPQAESHEHRRPMFQPGDPIRREDLPPDLLLQKVA